jgi:murein DD-endopeptidase MepM/ murein hydrolase activator NlpD
MKRMMTSLLATGTLTAAVVAAAPLAAEAAGARPAFKAPFNCGETWRGSAWTEYQGIPHKPMKSVDWNLGAGDADNGKAVRASAAGTVEHAGPHPSGYGRMVLIKHGTSGWKTRYAHLKDGSVAVNVGDRVNQGQLIGRVGKTGGQESSHLHYEQIRDGAVVNSVVQGITFDPNDVHYIKSTNHC